jgi:predicted metal-binding membrane protein
MFGEGVASLPWMIGLTVVMVGEAIDRRGPRLGRLVGIALIVAALATLNGAAV